MTRPRRTCVIMMSWVVFASATGTVGSAQHPTPRPPDRRPPPSETPAAHDALAPIELPRKHGEHWSRFSQLSLWEDGLSEMSYYDATCVLYGKERRYTRVHLLNRQFMNPYTWVKAEPGTENAVPAFKFVISEEVPTENYNYRFLMTTFLDRPALDPLKVSVSSQEWCGHTYKSLLWARFAEAPPDEWSLFISSYSYFADDGDRYWGERADVDAYETLFVLARAVAASGGESRTMRLLQSLRSNRGANPKPLAAVLRLGSESPNVKTPLGSFRCRRVTVDWTGPETWFDVELEPPFRLIAFRADDVKGALRFVERRAYWDRNQNSGFHPVGDAP